MTSTLSRRLGKVEVITRTRWLAQVDSTCPWVWTERFFHATSGFAPVLARAEELAPESAPAYLRERVPRLSAGQVAYILGRESEFFFHTKDFETWEPPPRQRADFLLLVDLFELSKSYALSAGDPIPSGHVISMRGYCNCKERCREEKR